MRRFALALILSAALAVTASAAEKKKGGGDSFLQLPTISATVAKPGGRGVMTIDVGVDVADAGLRHRAEQSIPLLRDAYLREMLTYAPTLAPGQPPNPDVIGAFLQRATDRTLGKPGARILLGTIMIN